MPTQRLSEGERDKEVLWIFWEQESYERCVNDTQHNSGMEKLSLLSITKAHYLVSPKSLLSIAKAHYLVSPKSLLSITKSLSPKLTTQCNPTTDTLSTISLMGG